MATPFLLTTPLLLTTPFLLTAASRQLLAPPQPLFIADKRSQAAPRPLPSTDKRSQAAELTSAPRPLPGRCRELTSAPINIVIMGAQIGYRINESPSGIVSILPIYSLELFRFPQSILWNCIPGDPWGTPGFLRPYETRERLRKARF